MVRRFVLAVVVAGLTGIGFAKAEEASSSAIPWSEIGARATADYQGDGLSVGASGDGAILKCVFQRLEGEATPEGLWLTSTASDETRDRFRVVARDVNGMMLPATGRVAVNGGVVQFLRDGLVEEYSTSIDGVRQDFVVLTKPVGADGLRVGLSVDGAQVRGAGDGAQLILNESGRKLSYSRLRVTDAEGRELAARIEVGENSAARAPRQAREARALPEDEDSNYAVTEEARALPGEEDSNYAVMREAHAVPRGNSKFEVRNSTFEMAVVVDDTDAVYPVRIDPTFSDDNWIGIGGHSGASLYVYAVHAGDDGHLYVGGIFRSIGGVIARNVAMWNGTSWQALGDGLDLDVLAFASAGPTNLYVGGAFTGSSGTNMMRRVARWDGQRWHGLKDGMTKAASGVPYVRALAVQGNDLYVGGDFTEVDHIAITNIARWDGANWHPVGAGFDNTVYALCAPPGRSNELYAAGSFNHAGSSAVSKVARWDGSSWNDMGGGLDERGSTLLFEEPDSLYVGGYFSEAGGSVAGPLVRWDGSAWHSVGLNGTGVIKALTSRNGDIFAAGKFSVGTTSVIVARWDGSAWQAIGSGDAHATSIAFYGDDLFAGGEFFKVNGLDVKFIAKWSGVRWEQPEALPMGVSDEIRAMTVFRDELYIGGWFQNEGKDNNVSYLARWRDGNWQALGTGVNAPVSSLLVWKDALYVGGQFTSAGSDTNGKAIARWNGASWSPLKSGINGSVAALSASDSELYAGGNFTSAGSMPANYVARWDGSTWNALGSGVDNRVHALLAGAGGGVTVGGAFNNAGGSPASRIAFWSGSSWNGYSAGLSGGDVLSLSRTASLYAGGSFTSSGGSNIYGLARWTGSGWVAVGSGLSSGAVVRTLLAREHTGSLFVGGEFTSAGGVATTNIAEWAQNSWKPVGGGAAGTAFLPPSVGAMAFKNGALFVGGIFTNAGGFPARNIARWDGLHWFGSYLDFAGVNGGVVAIALDGTNVYIGGDFTYVGGLSAHRVAKWDGTHWSALGSGADGDVSALAIQPQSGLLYVGGNFFEVGGNTNAERIAAWNGTEWKALHRGLNASVEAIVPDPASSNVYVGGHFLSAIGQGYVKQLALWDGSTWSTVGGGIDQLGSSVFALLYTNGVLYVGGNFTNVGASTSARSIASWDGSSWTAYGGGASGTVRSLAKKGSDLFIGGSFSSVDGKEIRNVARWDGSVWSPLGSNGISGTVNAMVLDEDGNLYVTGQNLNVWPGGFWGHAVWEPGSDTWSGLGSGLGPGFGSGYALALGDEKLYIGGHFGTAGGKISANFALAKLYAEELPFLDLSIRPSGGNLIVSWPSAGSSNYVLQQTANLATQQTWTGFFGSPSDDGTNKYWTITPANWETQKFYRLYKKLD